MHSEKQKGNCFAACLASLFDIPLKEIPAFEESKNWGCDFIDWIDKNNIDYTMHNTPPKGYAMANGISPRGIRHSVIVKDGRFFHDPHPSREFLTKINDYWLFTK